MKNPVKKYLFTPGPAPVPPEVLLEMARPMIHHRTPEFSAVLDQARERMRPLFGTRQEVLLLAASGTGAMEAAVVNLLAPGELRFTSTAANLASAGASCSPRSG